MSKKWMALLAMGGLVVASVAMAMSTGEAVATQVDDAKVNAVIDARLHEMLLQAQIDHPLTERVAAREP